MRKGGAATGADLGGSSNYLNEILKSRSEEGFLGKSNLPRVSRKPKRYL